MKEMDVNCQKLGDYQLISELGKCSWSDWFVVEHVFIKKQYVLKKVFDYLVSDTLFIEQFRSTISKLAKVGDKRINSIENVSFCNDACFIIEPYDLKQGVVSLSLYDYIKNKDNLSESDIVFLLKEIADILDLARQYDIAHGFLTLESIVIEKYQGDLKVVLKEFEINRLIAKHLFSKEGFRSLLGNSFLKMDAFFSLRAPECDLDILDGLHQEDAYAFGAIAYYLLFKMPPKGGICQPSKIFPHYEYDWDFVIKTCLDPDPQRRPKVLSTILRKKTSSAGECLLNIIDESVHESIRINSDNEIRSEEEIIDACTESVLKVSPQESIKKVVKEFVLVKAKSIDEAMDTSIGEEHQEDTEGYTHILQSMLHKEPVVSHYQEKEKHTLDIEPILTAMIFVEGGECFRGSMDGQRDERPVHKVVLTGFFMDIHPVTNEQFVKYLLYVGGEQDKNFNNIIRLKDSRIQRKSGDLVIETGYQKHPVVGVTWYGATGYAEWVGKRLPTEAEWEIASKGGKKHFIYPTGEDIEKKDANFFSSDTTAVMSYSSNAIGLYDMAGNVYEWCQDWYDYDFYEFSSVESKAPSGPPQGVYRVLRGGCWKSLKVDLRCAHRHRNNPGTVNSTYGFRCVKDL